MNKRRLIAWLPLVGFASEIWGVPYFAERPGDGEYYASAVWHAIWINVVLFSILWGVT